MSRFSDVLYHSPSSCFSDKLTRWWCRPPLSVVWYFYIFSMSDILCELNDVNRHSCGGKIKRGNNVNTRGHQLSPSVIHKPIHKRSHTHSHTHSHTRIIRTLMGWTSGQSTAISPHRDTTVFSLCTLYLKIYMAWRSPFDRYNCVYRVINLEYSPQFFF